MSQRWYGSLDAELERLAEKDPAVRVAAAQLWWQAQKAAMNWPEPRRFTPSGPERAADDTVGEDRCGKKEGGVHGDDQVRA